MVEVDATELGVVIIEASDAGGREDVTEFSCAVLCTGADSTSSGFDERGVRPREGWNFLGARVEVRSGVSSPNSDSSDLTTLGAFIVNFILSLEPVFGEEKGEYVNENLVRFQTWI
jgi:hypothetical protein